MTFSEALESYLENREVARHFGPGRNRTYAEEQMATAAEHMDALTGDGDPEGEAASSN
ncbi:hypothetical protein [Bordetella genomosp. 9]|uniref:hypothetical protein n=1 Tax=Bordetella genomosp. 9 TaxID=1416803 RepID=UPI0015C666E6|nr:hypothetical protein [Bordetella genomosp. 9]